MIKTEFTRIMGKHFNIMMTKCLELRRESRARYTYLRVMGIEIKVKSICEMRELEEMASEGLLQI